MKFVHPTWISQPKLAYPCPVDFQKSKKKKKKRVRKEVISKLCFHSFYCNFERKKCFFVHNIDCYSVNENNLLIFFFVIRKTSNILHWRITVKKEMDCNIRVRSLLTSHYQEWISSTCYLCAAFTPGNALHRRPREIGLAWLLGRVCTKSTF